MPGPRVATPSPGPASEASRSLGDERAAPEGGDLGVEACADPAHLAPADPLEPQGQTRSSTRRVLTPRKYASTDQGEQRPGTQAGPRFNTFVLA
jgi:hypothetical protein